MKSFPVIRTVTLMTLASVIAGVVLSSAATVDASGSVAINAANFPDKVFRAYVSKNFDKDGNGTLSDAEIRNVTEIRTTDSEYKEVVDLKGIEFFPELTRLDCQTCGLEKIDVSKNLKLELLFVTNNKLKSLDVSKNTELQDISCSNNQLKELDVTHTKKIWYLSCYSNKLTKLDISKNTELMYIECYGNELTSLDVSRCTKLKRLSCERNKITALDVSKNKDLVELSASTNQLASLDLSKNKSLTKLYCSRNKLTSLDIKDLTELTEVEAGENSIKSVNTGKLKKLVNLDLAQNQLKSIDVSKNTLLKSLVLNSNKLTSVNVSKNTALEELYVRNNGIASLDLSKNRELTSLDINLTKIKSIDLTPNYKLHGLHYDARYDMTIDLAILPGNSFYLGGDGASGSKVTNSNKAVIKMDDSMYYGLKAGTAKLVKTYSNAPSVSTFNVKVLYKDVTNSKDFWYEPTYYLTGKDVVKGYDKQTKFKPANECTRAQMVTFIWRLAGSPEPKSPDCKFKDVKKNDYFYKACIWGNENHIVEGYKDGTFGPKIVCARRHAVTFLWRLAGSPAPKTKTNKFSDVNKKDYFYQATLWASEMNILAGYSDGTFRPNGNCLRRQMVTFLYKYDKYINGKG